MELLDIDPSELQSNPWNANTVNPQNLAKLKKSMEDLGTFKPIICRQLADGTLQILAGEHRVQLAQEGNFPTVPVVNLGTIEDSKAKRIMLADNARYGSDDVLALGEILADLRDDDINLSEILPWTGEDIEMVMSGVKIDLEELEEHIDEPEEEEEPETSTPKTVKTHEILRFRVSIKDSENVRKAIREIQNTHGFTEDDDLTNAGDALVYLVCHGEIDETDE